MMKKLQFSKLAALLLAFVFVALAITGCKPAGTASSTPGGLAGVGKAIKNEESGEEYYRDENGIPQLNGTTLKIWIPMREYFNDKLDTFAQLDIMKELMEKMDVKLEFIHPAIGQEKEHFSLMVAGNELPDLIFSSGIFYYYPGDIVKAYDDGLLYDYTEMITEEITPNFIEKVVKDPYFSKAVYDDSGRIVRLGSGMSGSEESCAAMFGFMMRGDLLEATGLEKPVTIDDWYNVLTAMKKNGVQYPLVLDFKEGAEYWVTRNAFSAAYGLSAATFSLDENGKVEFGPYADAYKDYLATMNKWYAEGLINPDFMNQDVQQTWSMIADGKGAATASHLWQYASNYYTPVELEDPTKAMVAIDMPVLKKGDKINHMFTNRTLINHKYITADTKTPLACALFLDALYIDDIEYLVSYGIEGLGYTLDEYGYPSMTTLTADLEDKYFFGWSVYDFETATDDDLDYILKSKYCYGAQPDCIELMVQHSYSGIYPMDATLTSQESDMVAKTIADIKTYSREMMLKFITGNESLDNFDEYQQRLESEMNIEEVIAAHQAAYDRYVARGA